MSSNLPYFLDPAAAYIRGMQRAGTQAGLDEALVSTPFAEITESQKTEIAAKGLAAGLRLHRFKRTMGLRRVARVLGILRGLQPENLLDIGSGRGAFLWPLLDALPHLPVTATDILDHRLRDLRAVRDGGLDRLSVVELNAEKLQLADKTFDVVTFLETLEHIPDAQSALNEAVRVARRFVIASIPSKQDDNPEHIHLFDARSLETMFSAAGAARVNIEYVLNHIIAVAKVGGG